MKNNSLAPQTESKQVQESAPFQPWQIIISITAPDQLPQLAIVPSATLANATAILQWARDTLIRQGERALIEQEKKDANTQTETPAP